MSKEFFHLIQTLRTGPGNLYQTNESINQSLKIDIYILKILLLFWEGMVCNYDICQVFFCSKIEVTRF